MSYTPTGRIELPAHAYEAFLDLQDRILRYEVEPDDAVAEMERILSPYWVKRPEHWEATEVVLKLTPTSILGGGRG